MELVAEEFRRARSLEMSKYHERQKWFIAAKRDKTKREAMENEEESSLFDAAATTIIAEPAEIEAFKVELDAYDEATVRAIIENREILEALYQQRDAMLEAAYVLEDGTHVFKSEDGVTVITEFGETLSPDMIDPQIIEDHRPTAESFMKVEDAIRHHEQIDQKLMGYQEKLDEARDHVNSGELTQEELETMRKDLYAEMPAQARQQMPDDATLDVMPLNQEFNLPAAKVPTLSVQANHLPSFDLN